MIVPMLKYTFLVYHKEYGKFLEDLQQTGVLHVVEKKVTITNEIKEKYKQLDSYNKILQFLSKREVAEEKPKTGLNGNQVINDILQKQEKLEQLAIKLEDAEKELAKAKPWGNFSPDLINRLKNYGIMVQFYTTTKKSFAEIEKNLPVEYIGEAGNQLFFILIQTKHEKYNLDAEKIVPPSKPFSEIEQEIRHIQTEIYNINKCFDEYASSTIPVLEECKKQTINSLEYENVVLNTEAQANNKLMILEGWVPVTKKSGIDNYLSSSKVVFFSNKGTPDDKIPVLLKNNRFSKLFEPIGSMFSLPDYSELDLTVFFAPFFMLFFGFCLGDAGYGLLFIIGGGLYKLKATQSFKPYLSLIQLLGLATIIFGTISGTFFGINLIESEINWLAEYKTLFLNPEKMFNLALILGGVQIIFGLFNRAANQIKQLGISYALATFGWIIVLLGSVLYVLLSEAGIIPKSKILLTVILSLGGFFILFFSDPKINIFSRVGKGVWDVYSTITGIFGDLLSYIRLFALGLSSAILGFVINDIGIQILGSSKILGPVFFAIFLLLGHTLNILISSLGSFVHPMRLTFVEFYKSAGFKGGGEEYKPFGK